MYLNDVFRTERMWRERVERCADTGHMCLNDA